MASAGTEAAKIARRELARQRKAITTFQRLIKVGGPSAAAPAVQQYIIATYKRLAQQELLFAKQLQGVCEEPGSSDSDGKHRKTVRADVCHTRLNLMYHSVQSHLASSRLPRACVESCDANRAM